MVQVLPSSGFKSDLIGGLEKSLPGALEKLLGRTRQENQLREEDTALEQLGINASGIRDPRLRQMLLQGNQEQKQNAAKNLASQQELEGVESMLGKEAKELWPLLTEGAKTDFFKQVFKDVDRGMNLKESIGNFLAANPGALISNQSEASQNLGSEGEEFNLENLPQIQNGKLPKDLKLPDFTKKPKGFSSKAWENERREWGKLNAPTFEEARNKVRGQERDAMDISKLKQLSPNLPEGFEKLIVNPNTGEFYGLAQLAGLASRDAQEWVKVIARFGNRAKDAFGSRVTNFDLQQYMKQFPGLLNTKEGRESILEMMEINNRLDYTYDNALKQVYQKYGLTKIPPEQADRIAQELIRDEIMGLREQYANLDERNFELASGSSQNKRSLDEIFEGVFK